MCNCAYNQQEHLITKMVSFSNKILYISSTSRCYYVGIKGRKLLFIKIFLPNKSLLLGSSKD